MRASSSRQAAIPMPKTEKRPIFFHRLSRRFQMAQMGSTRRPMSEMRLKIMGMDTLRTVVALHSPAKPPGTGLPNLA